jgi:hypothetical protein
MPEERIDLRFAPELKVKDFWEKVPKIAYPAELLDLIGYFDQPKEVLMKSSSGKIEKTEAKKGTRGDIIIAYPSTKREEKLFHEFDKFLREMKATLQKIEESDNPEEYRLWYEMVKDTEVVLYSEIATLFDELRMKALRMALNEFNSSVTRERIMMMEKVREESNE